MDGFRRTAMAALLVAVGLTIPCVAWYIVGAHAVRERTRAILAEPRREASLEAARLARQLAMRLEALRKSESRRPFEDYLSGERLEQLLGECQPGGGIPSPLAEGPADPMIRAHFQIDDVGVVTLPALGRGSTSGGDLDGSAASLEHAMLNEIECASAEHLAALHRSPADGRTRQLASPRGVVTVGSFSWHTVPIDATPSLVALREVATPVAVLTQGFVVRADHVAEMLDGSPFPAVAKPGLPREEGDAQVPIQGDPWSVHVDSSAARAVAETEAARAGSRFHRTFGVGALAAFVVGAALVLLVRQTEKVGRERARFAAAAAHELRTPLAGIQLYGEMLADGSGDPARQEAYARRVSDEARRLGRVVSNVLGYSRLQRDGLAVSVHSGQLEPAVRAALEQVRPLLEAEGVSLELEVRSDLPPARFDPDALQQILLNLLDNAAKFSRQARDRTVHVTLAAKDGCPTLEVRDRGPGVDPAVRRHLFRPFTRHPDPDAPAGLGIGLAIVKALAGAQGADVSFREPPDGGAAFAVRFRPVA